MTSTFEVEGAQLDWARMMMMGRRKGEQDYLMNKSVKFTAWFTDGMGVYSFIKHELAHPSLNCCRCLLRRRDASLLARPTSSWLSERPPSTGTLCEERRVRIVADWCWLKKREVGPNRPASFKVNLGSAGNALSNKPHNDPVRWVARQIRLAPILSSSVFQ